jgi:hypothetical protein
VQVFKHLDSRSLTTTIPLVCQHWKAAAACDQIWKPRCDPQLLAAVQQQTPGAAAPDTFLSLSSDASSTAVATLSTQVAAVRSLTTANNPATAAVKPHYTVALPLLHHAVHSFNLLRNPLFSAAVNADYSSSLLRCRSGGSSSNGGSGKAPAVLTSEQRKFAWVRPTGLQKHAAGVRSLFQCTSVHITQLLHAWLGCSRDTKRHTAEGDCLRMGACLCTATGDDSWEPHLGGGSSRSGSCSRAAASNTAAPSCNTSQWQQLPPAGLAVWTDEQYNLSIAATCHQRQQQWWWGQQQHWR